MVSIDQKSTFSEHVAYQIKRNHEMQQYGRNVEIVQVSLFLLNYLLKTSW